MPKIPTYLASLGYEPARGSLDAAGAQGRALATFGDAVGQFGGEIAGLVKRREEDERIRIAADMAEQAQAAAAEVERADGTARVASEFYGTVEEFRTYSDPEAARARFPLLIGTMRQTIDEEIRDPQTRRQVGAIIQNFADLHAPIMEGERLHALSARAHTGAADNLAFYARTAAAARHPLEFDDLVDLAEREIRGKQAAGFFTAEQADEMEQDFYADLAEHQARHAIAADPGAALASLRGGEDFTALPAPRRARLLTEADRAVQAQAVRQATEKAAAQRDMLARLPAYLESWRDGDLPEDERFSRESLIATLGEEEGERRWAEIEEAQAFGRVMAHVRWASRAEIDGLVDRGDTSVVRETPASADDRRAITKQALITRAVERRNQQLWAKPADYVLNNPRVAELHAATTQFTGGSAAPAQLAPGLTSALQATGVPVPAAAPDEDRRDAVAAYANATLAEQERLGLPADRRQVLPERQAQELVARILDGDALAADRILRDLAADWGEAWPHVLADLARHGLPGNLRLLAGVENPIARQTFAKMLMAQTIDPGALRNKVGAEAEAVDRYLLATLPLIDDGIGAIQSGSVERDPSEAARALGLASADKNAFSVHSSSARRGAIKRAPIISEFPAPKAELLHDDDGEPVIVWSPDDGEDVQVMIPEGVSLNFFAEMGEADRDLGWPEQMVRLGRFLWGHPWDLQRPVTKLTDGFPSQQRFRGEFRDVATIAIGVYAAAAGIPLNTILNYQMIAAHGSEYAPSEIISSEYGPLADRNVRNTELGYNLYKLGKIKAK